MNKTRTDYIKSDENKLKGNKTDFDNAHGKKTNFEKLGILFTIAIPIFIILTTVLFVFSFKFLYYYDIENLDLVAISGYSKDLIKRNYDYLISYCLGLTNPDFMLPDLVSSQNAIIHFEDVRKLLQNIIKVNFFFLFISIWGIIHIVKTKKYEYLRLISINIFAIPIILGIPFSLNFSKSFEVFHKIFFRNDYWLFDSRYDPIITILPEEFFFHSAVMMLAILILFGIIFYFFYKRLKRNLFSEKGTNNERNYRNYISGSHSKGQDS